MKIAAVTLITAAIILSGCMHSQTDQREVSIRDMGDAMNECRRYTRERIPELTGISIDRLSTRETKRKYDIYINITDGQQNGYVQCQIDKKFPDGVAYHSVREFVQKARSFSG